MNTRRDLSDYDQVIIRMRHAESEANVAYRRIDRDKECRLYYGIGGFDERVKLTQQGKYQAEAAGRKLRQILRADRPLEEVLVSEFFRTEETALNVMRELGIRAPLIHDARLNKRRQGLFWNMTYYGVQTKHTDEYERYLADLKKGGLNYAPPGGEGHQDGESYKQLFARTDALHAEYCSRTDRFLSLWVDHLSSELSLRRKTDRISDRSVRLKNDAESVDNAEIVAYGRMLDGNNRPFKRINLDVLLP
ncbi:MAG: histidine phosphatase family protein [Candidatus Obscuribacterales bacterium]|nr:histidine phosphatase family protein [Candidatus Obscuribacterales bacterium]